MFVPPEVVADEAAAFFQAVFFGDNYGAGFDGEVAVFLIEGVSGFEQFLLFLDFGEEGLLFCIDD